MLGQRKQSPSIGACLRLLSSAYCWGLILYWWAFACEASTNPLHYYGSMNTVWFHCKKVWYTKILEEQCLMLILTHIHLCRIMSGSFKYIKITVNVHGPKKSKFLRVNTILYGLNQRVWRQILHTNMTAFGVSPQTSLPYGFPFRHTCTFFSDTI